MSDATVFPVGQYAGMRENKNGPDGYRVRVGRDLEYLDDDQFAVWGLAHGLPDTGKDSWSQDDIVDRAVDIDLVDAHVHVQELARRGLLASVPTDHDRAGEAMAFASRHRLRALLIGLGSRPGAVDTHAVGVLGVGTAAILDESGYRLWQWGTTAESLRQYVTELDDATDPVELLPGVLADLRVLVANGCAYLDAVPAAAGPDRAPTSDIARVLGGSAPANAAPQP